MFLNVSPEIPKGGKGRALPVLSLVLGEAVGSLQSRMVPAPGAEPQGKGKNKYFCTWCEAGDADPCLGLLGNPERLENQFPVSPSAPWGAGPREQLSVTSFPCQRGNSFPSRKGFLLRAPETSFLFPPCPDTAGGKEELS